EAADLPLAPFLLAGAAFLTGAIFLVGISNSSEPGVQETGAAR
ncbi:unnamed protein product, partial [Urochloa humidicola]